MLLQAQVPNLLIDNQFIDDSITLLYIITEYDAINQIFGADTRNSNNINSILEKSLWPSPPNIPYHTKILDQSKYLKLTVYVSSTRRESTLQIKNETAPLLQ